MLSEFNEPHGEADEMIGEHRLPACRCRQPVGNIRRDRNRVETLKISYDSAALFAACESRAPASSA
jgi:hypothetical protein